MAITAKLLNHFLDKARSLGAEIEPIKILRTNTFRIGKANVLVRTASDLGRRFFFGLNYINAEEIYNLQNSFVAFICGEIDKTIFMPTDVLIRNLPNISHDRNGEYKINFTHDGHLVLRGRNNVLDCKNYLNNWNMLLDAPLSDKMSISPDESLHNVIQGRLIEIGNIRGFSTYSPDKNRFFNKRKILDLISISECPQLQFADYNSIRNIDVMWFRRTDTSYYPEYAFEVELSTGVWSGFGRLAALREYNTKFFIVTNDDKKFSQVARSFPELKPRYLNLTPEKIGLLYSAEKNLIDMRNEFKL